MLSKVLGVFRGAQEEGDRIPAAGHVVTPSQGEPVVVLSEGIIQVFWACAADQIADAEKLLAEEKK